MLLLLLHQKNIPSLPQQEKTARMLTVQMRNYIIRRLLLMPITLIGITFLVFCLTRMVPGGPVERILQEQSIGALAGDKALGGPTDNSMGEDDIERLEELFNLQEPVWKAYLQWLGLMPHRVEIAKAPFGKDGSAYITLNQGTGRAVVIEVQRDGSQPLYRADPWFSKQHWKMKIESPHERARRWAKRHGIKDMEQIEAYSRTPACHWRAVAYRNRLDGLLQGNLGLSYKYNEPVWQMMCERLPASLYLGFLGAMVTYLVSIPLGVLKALNHHGLFDSLSSVLIFIGYAVPGFALGAVLLVYLGARLEFFPMYGLVSPGFEHMSWSAQLQDLTIHTILPLSCYVVSTFAMTTMMMKNCLMGNLSADYIRTAVAKGVSFPRAVWKHAFRNSVIPIASTLGGVICTIVGGSLLIERVFDIQGFGMLSFQALMDKDYSLIMGTLLLSSLVIIIGNLLSDLLVAFIDPRIKFE